MSKTQSLKAEPRQRTGSGVLKRMRREGYVPSVVHAIERQRYYEVLRQTPTELTKLVAESLNRTLDSAGKFVDQIEAIRAAS